MLPFIHRQTQWRALWWLILSDIHMASVYPDIWSNTTLGETVRVFLTVMNIWIYWMSKVGEPFYVGGPHPFSARPE
jgi:hypothetical protein